MRPIVVLLIAALVLTPTLAHATAVPGEAAVALVAIPVVVVMLLTHLVKSYPREKVAGAAPSPGGTTVAPVADINR